MISYFKTYELLWYRFLRRRECEQKSWRENAINIPSQCFRSRALAYNWPPPIQCPKERESAAKKDMVEMLIIDVEGRELEEAGRCSSWLAFYCAWVTLHHFVKRGKRLKEEWRRKCNKLTKPWWQAHLLPPLLTTCLWSSTRSGWISKRNIFEKYPWLMLKKVSRKKPITVLHD